MIGHKHSKETRKMSEQRKGIKQPIMICPYSKKQGGASNMKRWYFDNCKLKD